ncbi:MAG TPA: Tex family protein [Gammaproteobacteria bacterium]|nr:Tex family protein [Gammaproteobacteria bacterium]
MSLERILPRLAEETGAAVRQVMAAVELLDSGATVPFIARYRKEATGGLDDAQLRLLEDRLRYHRELEDRRSAVLASIEEQGKLTDELRAQIEAADTKTRLEDLYRPYMKKRRTKAQIAREAGLEPLADALFADPTLVPETVAAEYVDADKGVEDAAAALEGARQILMERFAEDPELTGRLREFAWENGRLQSKVREGKEEEGAKFADYFDAIEAVKKVPSHRALAMFRGQTEEVLTLSLVIDELDEEGKPKSEVSVGELMIARHFGIEDKGRASDRWLLDTVRWTWKVKLQWHIEMEIKKRLREIAEEEAIKVFARNLKDLLLAAPAGPRVTMGLDPGVRTGVKVAVVDATGKLLDTATVYPFQPRNDVQGALATLAALCQKHKVELIAIGNGTYSRETDRLAGELLKGYGIKASKIVISEAGASVYSASEIATKEFPDIDVSLRGAISIARRLQDPLAELVKIEPKSIGVGQYQHDVSQVQLARALDAVVEDCVNAVGVDVNTASAPLLARVSGLGPGLAENIVEFRNQNGAFRNRRQLLKVPRLGEKAFEQCAGFLRIMNGDNPLDASAVHPEAYPVVEKIISACGKEIRELIGDTAFLRGLSANDFTDERFGEPTVKDILAELEKPGRDPRPEFRTAEFKEGVNEIADLKPGMRLQGVVTNVANFGAFVDIGVHQDGLVHISQLADRFVKDPHEVVKTGDIVSVRVVDVDIKRKRIALSMRSDDAASADLSMPKPSGNERARKQRAPREAPAANNPFADALAGWKKK